MFKKFLSAALSLCLLLPAAIVPSSALELEDAKNLLKDYYVDGVPDAVLELDSLEAVLEALGDPYTTYMTAEEYEQFLAAVNGDSVVGIGVSMESAYQDGFRILSILPDSPALEAGLMAGDRIVEVDGTPLTDGADIRTYLSGPEGSSVTVTVIRDSTGQQLDFTMLRRSVLIPIVTWETFGDAVWIDCASFGNSTMETVGKIIAENEDTTALWVMDLRSNPGGISNAAAGTASLFVGSEMMVYLRDAAGTYNYIYTTTFARDLTDKPLLILTSPHSASAAEQFTAAARDHEFGISIGQRTFGKGIAQNLFDAKGMPDLFDGDCMKISTYRFFSPNGATNQHVGILPTLLIAEEHLETAAALLSGAAPRAGHTYTHLRLDFAGGTYYIDLAEAMEPDNRAAFAEILASLPPFCDLRMGQAGKWTEPGTVTAADVATELGLDYESRFPFTDLSPEPWAETLAVYGLISGYGDGTFRPSETITRAEFCSLLANALNLPAAGATPFSDVSADAWYAKAVSAMAAKGFLAGYEDGTFRPGNPISHQEMLTVLNRAAVWLSMEGYAADEKTFDLDDWADYYNFAEWARRPVRNLVDLGFSLDLNKREEAVTRLESAQLLYQLMTVSRLFWETNPEELASIFPHDAV